MSVTLSVDLDCAKCHSGIWDEDEIMCKDCADAPKPREAVDQFKDCLRQVLRVAAMRPDWGLLRICKQVLADNDIDEYRNGASDLEWHRFPIKFPEKACVGEGGES